MDISDSTVRPVILSGFGPPSLACIRSWGRKGLPVGMICIRSREETIPRSKYLKEWIDLRSDKLYTSDGLQTIYEFARRFRASGIVCIAEDVACWLNDHREKFLPDVSLWFSSTEAIQALLSKQKQIEIAQKVGFDLLPTHLLDKVAKINEGIPDEHFPLCLRPTCAGTVAPSFKVHLAYSPAELRRFIERLKKIDKPIIAQPFRSMPNLVVHGARTIEGHSIGLQAFLVDRKFEGLTLTIRPAEMGQEFRDRCIEFTNSFGVTGNYHFEFLMDKKNGAIYFLELNNRLGGTTAKVFALGYDEPLLALQAYGVVRHDSQPPPILHSSVTKCEQPASSIQQPEATDKHPSTCTQQASLINHRPLANASASSKKALTKYCYYTLTGRLTPLDYPTEPIVVRIVKTIYYFLKCKDDVFSLRDLKGTLAYYFGNLLKRA